MCQFLSTGLPLIGIVDASAVMVPTMWDVEWRSLHYCTHRPADNAQEDESVEEFLVGYRSDDQAPEVVRLRASDRGVSQRSTWPDRCFEYPNTCTLEEAREWAQSDMAFGKAILTADPAAALTGARLLCEMRPSTAALCWASAAMRGSENEEQELDHTDDEMCGQDDGA